MIKAFYFLMFIFSFQVVKSQPGDGFDRSIKQISINKDSVESIKKLRKFEYVNTIDSLLKKSMQKEFAYQEKENSFFETFFNSLIFKFIAFLLIGFLISWLAINFLGRKGLFKKNNIKQVALIENEEIYPENALDYNEKIILNISNKNFRLAIKYFFLQTLIMLSESDLIQRKTSKTNIEYLNELPVELKSEFANLIKLYNYVWYGEIDIDENAFLKMQQNFITFQKKL